MIETSDEGTSYCTQCELYARRIEKLEALKRAAEEKAVKELKAQNEIIAKAHNDIYQRWEEEVQVVGYFETDS